MTWDKLRREASLIFRTFYSFLTGEFSYHAGALTYNSLMVLGSLLTLLSLFALYTPLLSYERLVSLIVQLLPQYAGEVITRLARVYESKAVFSSLSVALAYLFSVSFAKNLYKSFAYVSHGVKRRGEAFFWVFVPIFIMSFSLLSVLMLSLFALLKFLPLKMPLGFVFNLFFLLIALLVLYRVFLEADFKRVLYSSLLVSFMLSLFNKAFASLLIKLVSINPLQGMLGSFLLFLVWLYFSFQFILLGAKIINHGRG